MLGLAFTFDPAVDANPISSEHTQTQLDEFRQMPWMEPDYKQMTLDLL